MAYSYITYSGDGSNTTFTIPFEYINATDVTLEVDGSPVDAEVSLSEIIASVAPATGTNNVTVRRTTNRAERVVDYAEGSTITEANLDDANKQALFLAQEILDGAAIAGLLDTANLLFGEIADRPAPGIADRAYFATDTGEISVDNGTAWITAESAALTGDVTKSVNSTATTIANAAINAAKLATNAVTTAKILASNVTLAKIQDIATDKLLGRTTAATGVVEEVAFTDVGQSILAAADAAAVKTVLGIASDTPPSIHVHRNAIDQANIATSTWTKVEHNVEAWDIGGAYDSVTNYRWTPLTAGKYLVIASVRYNNIADTKSVKSAIYKNGVIFKQNRDYSADSADDTATTVTCIVEMNGTSDYLEHFTQHTHGSDRALQGNVDATMFQGTRISG